MLNHCNSIEPQKQIQTDGTQDTATSQSLLPVPAEPGDCISEIYYQLINRRQTILAENRHIEEANSKNRNEIRMTNPEVDWFFKKPGKWQQAYLELRDIVLDCGLSEELKWGCPCYTHHKSNVVLIHGFKNYCALLFMQGALLKDPKKILVQQTKNVQSARQIRFTKLDDIIKSNKTIKSYVKEAIRNDKAGLKVELKKTTEYEIPAEFQIALDEMPDLKSAFLKLTPGRQRAYLLYFSSARQSKTKMERVEKYIPKILDGKGLND